MILSSTPIEGTDGLRHLAMWVTRPCPQTCTGRQVVYLNDRFGPCDRCGA